MSTEAFIVVCSGIKEVTEHMIARCNSAKSTRGLTSFMLHAQAALLKEDQMDQLSSFVLVLSRDFPIDDKHSADIYRVIFYLYPAGKFEGDVVDPVDVAEYIAKGYEGLFELDANHQVVQYLGSTYQG